MFVTHLLSTWHMFLLWRIFVTLLQCVAVCCSVLCTLLQCKQHAYLARYYSFVIGSVLTLLLWVASRTCVTNYSFVMGSVLHYRVRLTGLLWSLGHAMRHEHVSRTTLLLWVASYITGFAWLGWGTSVLLCVPRNTLQHTATHCITLQHTATHYNTHAMWMCFTNV